ATTGSKSQLPDGRLAGLVGLHGLVVERLAPARLQELVGKAQNLKTVAIAYEPKIQLVPFAVGGASLDEAGQTRLLFDGSIDARRPATRSGKECHARSGPLPVRDLYRVEDIADVVDPGAGTSRAAGGQRRIVLAIHGASFGGIVEDPAADFRRLIEEFRAIGRVVHLEHELGDD